MSIGFGTYKIPKEETTSLVRYAIEAGCRLIDTAQLYGNETEVWDVVKHFSNISVTTKIHRKLIKSADKDNRSIETSIIHTPTLVLLHSPEKNFPIAWEQLKRLPCSIGVSNFTIDDLKKLSSTPDTNQIEVTPFNTCSTTIEYCQKHNIKIQAHSSLTKGELLDCTELQHPSLTPAQTMIAWSLTNQYIPIFSSKNPNHIKEIFETSITPINLNNLHIGYRTHPQYKV